MSRTLSRLLAAHPMAALAILIPVATIVLAGPPAIVQGLAHLNDFQTMGLTYLWLVILAALVVLAMIVADVVRAFRR